MKYSVIIPHKNTPQLLQRMLDSIPQRDDLEVIVVDDNSDPTIVDFSGFPGINRTGTKMVFNKEGHGAGYARNVGMDAARGEWLLFADADDYFITENLNRLLDTALPSDCELLVWDMRQTPFQTEEPDFNGTGAMTRYENMEMIYEKYISPWYKMVKRSSLESHHIRFDETFYSNDVMYSVKLALGLPCYYFLDSVVYVNDTQPTGLMNTKNYKSIAQRVKIELEAKKTLRKHNRRWFTSGWLEEMYKINYPAFVFCVLREWMALGFSHMWKDYLLACKYANTSPNPFKQIIRRFKH